MIESQHPSPDPLADEKSPMLRWFRRQLERLNNRHLEAIAKRPKHITEIPPHDITSEMCVAAISQEPELLTQLPDELRSEPVVVEALKRRPDQFSALSLAFGRQTPQMLAVAVEHDPNALNLVPQEQLDGRMLAAALHARPELLLALQPQVLLGQHLWTKDLPSRIPGVVIETLHRLQLVQMSEASSWLSKNWDSCVSVFQHDESRAMEWARTAKRCLETMAEAPQNIPSDFWNMLLSRVEDDRAAHRFDQSHLDASTPTAPRPAAERG